MWATHDAELSKWLTHDAELSKWRADGKYLSHDIGNEQVKIMAGIVLRGIIKDSQSAGFYAVLVDEASDVCEHEQLCATMRWVEKDFTICEEPVGLFCVSKTDSSTLFTVMKDILCRCLLPLALCRGQAYDGAANMSGHVSGVATRLKAEQPAALHVHCLAHSLNLCLQDATRTCIRICDTIEMIRELVKLIKYSPKRTALFEKMQVQVSPDTGPSMLKPLCPTPWTVRTGTISAITRCSWPVWRKSLLLEEMSTQ